MVGEGESESHSIVSKSLQPHGLCSPWNSPGQNNGVGRLSLLQGIFPTQELNPGLPHCRRKLYQLSHKGSLGEGEGGMNPEIGQTYTHCCVYNRQLMGTCGTTQGVQLCADVEGRDRGDGGGKEIQEGGDICIHVAESLRCTAKINNIVRQLYSNFLKIATQTSNSFIQLLLHPPFQHHVYEAEAMCCVLGRQICQERAQSLMEKADIDNSL